MVTKTATAAARGVPASACDAAAAVSSHLSVGGTGSDPKQQRADAAALAASSATKGAATIPTSVRPAARAAVKWIEEGKKIFYDGLQLEIREWKLPPEDVKAALQCTDTWMLTPAALTSFKTHADLVSANACEDFAVVAVVGEKYVSRCPGATAIASAAAAGGGGGGSTGGFATWSWSLWDVKADERINLQLRGAALCDALRGEDVQAGCLVALLNPTLKELNPQFDSRSISVDKLENVLLIGTVKGVVRCGALTKAQQPCRMLVYVPSQGNFCRYHVSSKAAREQDAQLQRLRAAVAGKRHALPPDAPQQQREKHHQGQQAPAHQQQQPQTQSQLLQRRQQAQQARPGGGATVAATAALRSLHRATQALDRRGVDSRTHGSGVSSTSGSSSTSSSGSTFSSSNNSKSNETLLSHSEEESARRVEKLLRQSSSLRRLAARGLRCCQSQQQQQQQHEHGQQQQQQQQHRKPQHQLPSERSASAPPERTPPTTPAAARDATAAPPAVAARGAAAAPAAAGSPAATAASAATTFTARPVASTAATAAAGGGAPSGSGAAAAANLSSAAAGSHSTAAVRSSAAGKNVVAASQVGGRHAAAAAAVQSGLPAAAEKPASHRKESCSGSSNSMKTGFSISREGTATAAAAAPAPTQPRAAARLPAAAQLSTDGERVHPTHSSSVAAKAGASASGVQSSFADDASNKAAETASQLTAAGVKRERAAATAAGVQGATAPATSPSSCSASGGGERTGGGAAAANVDQKDNCAGTAAGATDALKNGTKRCSYAAATAAAEAAGRAATAGNAATRAAGKAVDCFRLAALLSERDREALQHLSSEFVKRRYLMVFQEIHRWQSSAAAGVSASSAAGGPHNGSAGSNNTSSTRAPGEDDSHLFTALRLLALELRSFTQRDLHITGLGELIPPLCLHPDESVAELALKIWRAVHFTLHAETGKRQQLLQHLSQQQQYQKKQQWQQEQQQGEEGEEEGDGEETKKKQTQQLTGVSAAQRAAELQRRAEVERLDVRAALRKRLQQQKKRQREVKREQHQEEKRTRFEKALRHSMTTPGTNSSSNSSSAEQENCGSSGAAASGGACAAAAAAAKLSVEKQKQLLEQIMNVKSTIESHVNKAEYEEEQQMLKLLEKQDVKEEFKQTIKELSVQAWHCQQCDKYSDKVNPVCKAEGHTFTRVNTKKRFFACPSCNYSPIVAVGQTLPEACPKCRTALSSLLLPAISAYKAKSVRLLPHEVLSIDGEEDDWRCRLRGSKHRDGRAEEASNEEVFAADIRENPLEND